VRRVELQSDSEHLFARKGTFNAEHQIINVATTVTVTRRNNAT
jgi:hypothetical protein